MNSRSDRTILLLTLPLAALVAMAGLFGLLVQETYSRETVNWSMQAIGQDTIDLFLIVPLLLVADIAAFMGNKKALLLWSGVVLYLIYTFTIYTFAVHFNRLFLVYCVILGLAFYAFLYFLSSRMSEAAEFRTKSQTSEKVTAIYFILMSCFFEVLWLSEVIPATIFGTTPVRISRLGLLVNPVHALDLSVFLPGIMIVGILLLRKKPLGFLLAPALLVFFILMDFTIGSIALAENLDQRRTDLSLIYIMIFLALFSIILLLIYLKNMSTKQ